MSQSRKSPWNRQQQMIIKGNIRLNGKLIQNIDQFGIFFTYVQFNEALNWIQSSGLHNKGSAVIKVWKWILHARFFEGITVDSLNLLHSMYIVYKCTELVVNLSKIAISHWIRWNLATARELNLIHEMNSSLLSHNPWGDRETKC